MRGKCEISQLRHANILRKALFTNVIPELPFKIRRQPLQVSTEHAEELTVSLANATEAATEANLHHRCRFGRTGCHDSHEKTKRNDGFQGLFKKQTANGAVTSSKYWLLSVNSPVASHEQRNTAVRPITIEIKFKTLLSTLTRSAGSLTDGQDRKQYKIFFGGLDY